MATAQLKSNMTIKVSCMTPFICITFKTTSPRNIRKKAAFIIEPFCSSNSTVLLSRYRDKQAGVTLKYSHRGSEDSERIIYLFQQRPIFT